MSFGAKILLFIGCCGIALLIFMTGDIFKETRNRIQKSVHSVIYANDQRTDNLQKARDSTVVYNVVGLKGDSVFMKDELAKYDGSEGSPGLYLGILGRVYDVAGGERHYGEGGGYSFFRARDGTKAYMTGEFNEKGLVDEVSGLSYIQMLELEDWIKFYDKTYKYKGKLVGNFYNEKGEPTELLLQAVNDINDAHVKKREAEKEKAKMPPCNAQQKEGIRRVWCTKQSGGVRRDWVGVPRMLYKQGSTLPRCVCVRSEDLNNPQLQEYKNCDPQAESCQIQTDTTKNEL